jgi:hypothetical protein
MVAHTTEPKQLPWPKRADSTLYARRHCSYSLLSLLSVHMCTCLMYLRLRVQQVKIADGSWERFVGVGVVMHPDYVDCNTDVIAVSESMIHRIRVLSWADGSVLAQFGSFGSGPDELWYPLGLRLLRDGNELVVADTCNNRLCLFTVTGDFVSTLANKDDGLSQRLHGGRYVCFT